MIKATLYSTDKPYSSRPATLDELGYQPVTDLTLVRSDSGELTWDAANGDDIGIKADNLDDAINDLRASYPAWPWHLEWERDYREYTMDDLAA